MCKRRSSKTLPKTKVTDTIMKDNMQSYIQCKLKADTTCNIYLIVQIQMKPSASVTKVGLQNHIFYK
jgi:hypothetical protein